MSDEVMAISSTVFKSICRDILEPSGVKVGGYRDELFVDLREDERENIQCQICFMIVKDPKLCQNKHLFCSACIFAWSMTSEENADRCPVCRVKGAYEEKEQLQTELHSKKVKCTRKDCLWSGKLSEYRGHDHGLEEVGVDPKSVELPSLRNSCGEQFHPLGSTSHGLSFDLHAERTRRQRHFITSHMELLEGQHRLAYLMDIFEGDLRRRRENINSLVSLQRRFSSQQFNEIMRLEAELGQITANLLTLIEDASRDVNRISHNLQTEFYDSNSSSSPSAALPIVSNSSTLDTTAQPAAISPQFLQSSSDSDSGVSPATGHPGSSGDLETERTRYLAARPRVPVRRARFFQVTVAPPSPVTPHPPQSEETEEAPAATNHSTQSRLLSRCQMHAGRVNQPIPSTAPEAAAHGTSTAPAMTAHGTSTVAALAAPVTAAQFSLLPPIRAAPAPSASNPYDITWPPPRRSASSENQLSPGRSPHRPS